MYLDVVWTALEVIYMTLKMIGASLYVGSGLSDFAIIA